MNKEKEFEEKILNKLLVDLKDIDKYKSFKNGSFIYDLGYYQGNLLINEIERLNNIIDEADTKNLELIQKINKIYDVIENKNITGIEARLLIQDILDKEE